jgi:hypothetical protein
MLLGTVLRGLRAVVCGMRGVAMGGVGVMRRLFMVTGVVVLCCLKVMVGRFLMVSGRRSVMFGTFVSFHIWPPGFVGFNKAFVLFCNRHVTDCPSCGDVQLVLTWKSCSCGPSSDCH